MKRNLFLTLLGLVVVVLVQQLVLAKMNSADRVYYGRTYNVVHNCSVSDSTKDALVDSTKRNVVFLGDVDSVVLENPRVRVEEIEINPLIYSRSMQYYEFKPEAIVALAAEVDSINSAQVDSVVAVTSDD